MSKVLRLARTNILNLTRYRSARSENTIGQIWLDANENPWINGYNRYPEPQPTQILTHLSVTYRMSKDEILITRGCDESIDLMIRAFCEPNKDSILVCPPTYGMYEVSARIQDVNIIKVPLINNFSIDIAKILTQKPKLLFICSPNNPTGNVIDVSNILNLCKNLQETIVIVDEAYIEFSDTPSLCGSVKDYENLVVLRTLSKAYGMAGLRVGATIANKNIIYLLKNIIPPYPISQPVIDFIDKYFTDDFLIKQKKYLNIIKQDREFLYKRISRLTCVNRVYPSQANFLLIKVKNINETIIKLNNAGIVVRNRHEEPGLKNCIRISIGDSDSNARCLEVLSGIN